MALRIGGARPTAPAEEEMPMAEEMPMEEMPVEEEMPMEEAPVEEPMPDEGMQMQGGMLDPGIAMYKSPEEGPFQCSNCEYYVGGGTCMILAAPVDEGGLCNLFTKAMQDEEMPAEDMPIEEELPAEPLEEEME